MLRCGSCSGLLAKGEKVCFSCGSKTAYADSPKQTKVGFHTLVTVFFYICLAMTLLSIFTSFGPKLSLIAPVTLILAFVKSSADQQHKNQA
jgi:hypothetical protein